MAENRIFLRFGLKGFIYMKKLFTATLILIAIFCQQFSVSASSVNLIVNSQKATSAFRVESRGGVTYADAKALSNAFGLSFKIYASPKSATIGSGSKMMCLSPDELYATVADLSGKSSREYEFCALLAPCVFDKSSVLIPVRSFADIFGFYIGYDESTKSVTLSRYAPLDSFEKIEDGNHIFYYQNQAEFSLPNSGSGYCWTCSYAMLISNLKSQKITPVDVAAINESKAGNGAYCYHSEIESAFDFDFVSAIPEDSIYYAGRDAVSGGTLINNPQKDIAVAIAALRQALTLHPEGVMVRYAAYPHTMVAVGYKDSTIIFNDPAAEHYKGVPFEETCVAAKGFLLSDLTFIQAID